MSEYFKPVLALCELNELTELKVWYQVDHAIKATTVIDSVGEELRDEAEV